MLSKKSLTEYNDLITAFCNFKQDAEIKKLDISIKKVEAPRKRTFEYTQKEAPDQHVLKVSYFETGVIKSRMFYGDTKKEVIRTAIDYYSNNCSDL